jgi:hypothetical protein
MLRVKAALRAVLDASREDKHFVRFSTLRVTAKATKGWYGRAGYRVNPTHATKPHEWGTRPFVRFSTLRVKAKAIEGGRADGMREV